jgi:hypothetical protein
MDKERVTALAARGEHIKTNKRGISLDLLRDQMRSIRTTGKIRGSSLKQSTAGTK